MAAVQRALGNFKTMTQLAVSATTVLTAAQAGTAFQCQGGSITLPLGSTLEVGSAFAFTSSATASVVYPNAADVIAEGAGGTTPGITLGPGDFLTLVYMGQFNSKGNWQILSGSSALIFSASFATGSNSQGTYFKFPSGLIIQVGTITASGGWAWSFPIAFPTNCLVCMATNVDTGASFTSLYNWTATSTYGDRWNLSGGNPTGETALVAFGH
jgi:hypothetical protein